VSSVIGLISNMILRFSSAAMLRNATYVAITTFLGLTYWYLGYVNLPMALFVSAVVGCATGIMIGLVAEYYTGGNPVRRLAENCQTGAATNIIYGLSLGMESVVMPVILLCAAVLISYTYGGGNLYGVSIAAVAMLATVGITMTVDAYGPIADNAGGIAEMAGFGKPVRDITDKLDALGNTTAAIGKGFAIGSALMTALVMFAAYAQKANLASLDVLNPWVMVGVFLGGIMPFLISALTMRSVGQAALAMVYEVRHQFRSIPGLMEGKVDPDYARCIAISTQASLQQMILPGVLTILLPVVVWFFCGVEALGGVLVGSTVTGVMMALFLSNVGGAWDNAKKYIEAGNLGGKGSESHKAAVIGDTVGDPCKDTSGPALNILIKLISVIALLLVSLR
jgi:K(+)-stimulated pyrophosphate-energized sodium pump